MPKRLFLLGSVVLALAQPVLASTIGPDNCKTSLVPCTSSWASVVLAGSTQVVAEDSGNRDTFAVVPGNRAHADYGSLGVEASGLVGIATAAFLDRFTITGSTGTGVMTVGWSLDGTIAVPAVQSGCFGSNCTVSIRLATLNATQANSLDFADGTVVPGGLANLVCCDGTAHSSTISRTGTVSVSFTYGVPFVFGLMLTGQTTEASNGSVHFFDTASLTGLVLPTGSLLVADSGTAFPITTGAVPEPSSMILLGSGLAVCLRKRRVRTDA